MGTCAPERGEAQPLLLSAWFFSGVSLVDASPLSKLSLVLLSASKIPFAPLSVCGLFFWPCSSLFSE